MNQQRHSPIAALPLVLTIFVVHLIPTNGQDYPLGQPNNPRAQFPQQQGNGGVGDIVVKRFVEYDPLPQHRNRHAAQRPHPFAGFLPGLISLIGSSYLLWWNEGRTAKEEATLRDAESCVVELHDYINGDSNNQHGKAKPKRCKREEGEPVIVHVTGDLSTGSGVTDEMFGLHRPDALLLKRSAETYQWKETKTERRTRRPNDDRYVDVEVTYQYSKVWNGRKINSHFFEERWGHENPMALPVEPGTTTRLANDITLLTDDGNKDDGYVWNVPGFLLEKSSVGERFETIHHLGQDEATNVSSPYVDDGDDKAAYIAESSGKRMVYLPFSEYAGKKTLPSISRTGSGQLQKQRRSLSIQRNSEMRYPPNIGDTRIFWTEVVAPPEGVSILASVTTSKSFPKPGRKSGDSNPKKVSFAPWIHKRTKRSVYELVPGHMTAKEMIRDLHGKNEVMGWILRGTGWLLNFIGWRLMFDCVPAIIRFLIPSKLGKSFLASIADIAASLVAFAGSIAMSILIISIAWLRYRPVWSAGLGVLSAMIMYGPWFLKHQWEGKKQREEYEPPTEEYKPPTDDWEEY